MKLKKIFAIALCALCFTACSDDDDNSEKRIEGEYYGAFVLNQGNMRNNIPGSLTNIDYETGTAYQNVYREVNGRVLGDTPQDAIIYGDRMYIAVYQSNVIEVVNKKTLKSEKTITLNSTGTQPRDLAAKGDYVYISMYDGYVSRLDTKTLTIDKTVKVGPNPEEITIAGDYLYVTNSDGMNYTNGYVNGKTVSKINLSTFTEEKKIEVGLNPTKIKSNGSDIFVICMGNYGDVPAMLKQIKNNDTVEDLFPATMMAINGNQLYLVNDPFYGTDTEYMLYTISSNTKKSLYFDNIVVPQGIGIEPSTGHIFISSLSAKSAYSEPFYVNEYTADGDFITKYDAGVGATCFVF